MNDSGVKACQKQTNGYNICAKARFFIGCEKVIQFCLCCFVKSPIESVVESVGSVTNDHGYAQRSRMTP